MSLSIPQTARRIASSFLEENSTSKPYEIVEPADSGAPPKTTKVAESVLAELGFSYLLTFRFARAQGRHVTTSLIRSLVSADESVVVDISQSGWNLAGFINAFFQRMLHSRLRQAFDTLRNGMRKRTFYDIESELADGRFLRTNNRADASYAPKSDRIEEMFVPYGTPVAQIVACHNARLQQEIAKGNLPRAVHSADDRIAMQERIGKLRLSAAINADWTREAKAARTGLSPEGSRLLFEEINKLFAPHRSVDFPAQSGEQATNIPERKAGPPPAAKKAAPRTGRNAGGTLLSALAFFGVGALLFSLKTALILLAVVAIHEGGHYLAMLASGYRDVKIFFVPGLGGVTMGQPTTVSLWRRLFVLLAGPVPGVIFGFAIFLMQSRGWIHADWVPELALTFIVINLLNLLPIVPLDGGQIVEALLSDRWIYARFVLALLSLLPLLFAVVYLHNTIFVVLLAFGAMSLPRHFRIARLLAAYRKEYGTAPVDMETAYNRLIDMQQLESGRLVPLNVAAQTAGAAAPALLVKPASWRTSLAGMAIYFTALLILPVAGAVALFHPASHLIVRSPDAQQNALNATDDWRKQKQAMLDDAKTDSDKWEILIYDAQEDRDLESAEQAWDVARKWPEGDARRITTLLALASARRPDHEGTDSDGSDRQLMQQARDEIASSKSLDHEKRLSLLLDLYLQDVHGDKTHRDSDLQTAYALVGQSEAGMTQASIRQALAMRRYAEGKPDEAESLLMQTYRANMPDDKAAANQEMAGLYIAEAARNICLIRMAQGHPDSALALANETLRRLPKAEALTQQLLLVQAHAATMLNDKPTALAALDELQSEFDARDSKQPKLLRAMSWFYSIGSGKERSKVFPALLIQQLDTYRRSKDARAETVAAQIRELNVRSNYVIERSCRPDGDQDYELEKGEPSWSSIYHQRLMESLNAFNLCPNPQGANSEAPPA
jgi:Zn-dependent protease